MKKNKQTANRQAVELTSVYERKFYGSSHRRCATTDRLSIIESLEKRAFRCRRSNNSPRRSICKIAEQSTNHEAEKRGGKKEKKGSDSRTRKQNWKPIPLAVSTKSYQSPYFFHVFRFVFLIRISLFHSSNTFSIYFTKRLTLAVIYWQKVSFTLLLSLFFLLPLFFAPSFGGPTFFSETNLGETIEYKAAAFYFPPRHDYSSILIPCRSFFPFFFLNCSILFLQRYPSERY